MTGLKRGVADTIPAAHAADALVWLQDDEFVTDGREYADGETVNAKVLVRTSTGVLSLDDATELEIEVDQRVFRPYPPGNVQIDGESIYSLIGEHPEPVLTLTHRDRLVQADSVVGHTEGSVGPEAGVTYVVRVYDEEGGTLLNTYPFAGDTWTYEAVDITADGDPPSVWMELVSIRDGIESYYHYGFPVTLVNDLFRVTEDDEYRLTEDGEERLIEG